MTAYPSWTPASRPGIVPLHPLSFGTILGRSFVALRQNPKVLLGFALVVQTLAYIAVLVLIGLASFATFSRLDTLRPGTEEFETVLAGSIALLVIVSFVLSLAAGAVSVVVQAVVVVEVTHAVVAEKLTLGAIWRQVKPSAWRLIGYSALLMLVIGAGLAILVTAVLALAAAAAPAAIVLTIFGILVRFRSCGGSRSSSCSSRPPSSSSAPRSAVPSPGPGGSRADASGRRWASSSSSR